MGWSDWQSRNRFIDERVVSEAIDAMVKFVPFGYEYVNVDDCWQDSSRHPITNALQPNQVTFQHGIKLLADKAHSLGLKFGLYTAIGNITCDLNAHGDPTNVTYGPGHNPGSLNYYDVDAQQFADWGVDYVKVDECGGLPADENSDGVFDLYSKFYDAINKTGRPMYYVTCGMNSVTPDQMNNPSSSNRTWAYHVDLDGWRDNIQSISNGWFTEWINNNNRFYRDDNGWSGSDGWLTILDCANDLSKPEFSGPGAFADMDAMSIGCNNATNTDENSPTTALNHTDCANGRQTMVEQQSQFSMWSMMSAPLMIGGDVRYINEIDTPEVWRILTNEEVIAIDQDALGEPASVVQYYPDEWRRTLATYTKRLSDPASPRAVAVLNRGDDEISWSLTKAHLKLEDDGCESLSLRDVWRHEVVASAIPFASLNDDAVLYTFDVESHATVVLRVMC